MNGERLKDLRKAKGMTQGELGEKLGVIKQTVSAWEHERYDPEIAMIERVAKYFEVSTAYLIGLTDEPDGQTTINVTNPLSPMEQKLLDEFSNCKDQQGLLKLVKLYNTLPDLSRMILLGRAAELSLQAKDKPTKV